MFPLLWASGFVDNMWTAKTGPLYVDLVQRTRSVLNRYPGSTIRAVLWHQGETEWEESADGYNALFPQQMTEMVAALREDLPIADTPFVMGGTVPAWSDRQTPNANAVLERIAADIGACFVSSEELLPMADGIHFELGSQIRLGQRYFDAMQNC